MMDEETLTHLTNLLKHSTMVEFHIPTVFCIDDGNPKRELIQEKYNEVQEAFKYFEEHLDYDISAELGLDIDETKISIMVIQ